MMSSWRSGSVTSLIASPKGNLAMTRPRATSPPPASSAQNQPDQPLDFFRAEAATSGSGGPGLELWQQRRDLGLEFLRGAVVGDDVVCARGLLVLRELAARAPLEVGGPARPGALSADGVLGDHTDGCVEGRVEAGLEQQRHLDHGEPRARRKRLAPGRDGRAHPRMQLRL